MLPRLLLRDFFREKKLDAPARFFPPEKNWMLLRDFFREKKLKCFFSSSSYPAQQHYNERNNGTTAPE
jgi:hypothetical protein